MKFSWKVFFCTIVIIAISLSFSGFILITSMFNMSVERETKQALNENKILTFAFETSLLNVPVKYEKLKDETIIQISQNLDTNNSGSLIRISDDNMNLLYSSDNFDVDSYLLKQTNKSDIAYSVVKINDNYFVHTSILLNHVERNIYLETLKDITSVFYERNNGFAIYSKVTAIVLFFGSFIMYSLSLFLTKPIKQLMVASQKMSLGDYSYRAKNISTDELGELTKEFNKMAHTIECNITEIQEYASAQEIFVGAFSHEMKTPLTSIIGYADLLRSRKMDQEHQFLSADYIYKEGKRLETLSLRLLDIIVLKKCEVNLETITVSSLFVYIKEIFYSRKDLELLVTYDESFINIEISLIKTVLINLIDNAYKAYEQNKTKKTVKVHGEIIDCNYYFSVQDFGCGIESAELKKIVKAFYVIDKSRAKINNGSGLGLSICSEILALHNSELKFESIIGVGTCVSFKITKI